MEQTIEYAHATGVLSSAWLLIAIPLVSAAVIPLLGRRGAKFPHWLGTAAIGAVASC